MRIGLVSCRCENRNISFNMSQMKRALEETKGKADLLCFGEAFLQGFDSLCWNYETDSRMAVGQRSETMDQIRLWTLEYQTDLLFGYIEKDGECLYSSCAVISQGKIVHNYRRISKGWKEFRITDEHYCEGNKTEEFVLKGRSFMISLCGDLWDYPERFVTKHILIWPVFLSFPLEEWENGALEEYARHAAEVSKTTLMINPIDGETSTHGGSFRFVDGKVKDRLPFDREGILIVDVG